MDHLRNINKIELQVLELLAYLKIKHKHKMEKFGSLQIIIH